MPGLMVNHGAPAPRQLTQAEDAQRIEGLRILARIIVYHHARHARSFRRKIASGMPHATSAMALARR